MYSLLNQLSETRQPRAAFDGLGYAVSSMPVLAKRNTRMRQLTAKERFETQGDTYSATHRFYYLGRLADMPDLQRENIIYCENRRFRILTTEQGKTQTSHHVQVDVVEVEGIE